MKKLIYKFSDTDIECGCKNFNFSLEIGILLAVRACTILFLMGLIRWLLRIHKTFYIPDSNDWDRRLC